MQRQIAKANVVGGVFYFLFLKFNLLVQGSIKIYYRDNILIEFLKLNNACIFSCHCSYLHTRDPPIVHGNLTTDTIFIQHNGLIKIGSGELSCLCGFRQMDIQFATEWKYVDPYTYLFLHNLGYSFTLKLLSRYYF